MIRRVCLFVGWLVGSLVNEFVSVLMRRRYFKLNTHHRRRRDSAVELSRVCGVNAPVGSRDPVRNGVELICDDIMMSLLKKL